MKLPPIPGGGWPFLTSPVFPIGNRENKRKVTLLSAEKMVHRLQVMCDQKHELVYFCSYNTKGDVIPPDYIMNCLISRCLSVLEKDTLY